MEGPREGLARQTQALVTPSDPLFQQQAWHYNAIRVPEAWSLTTGSSSVVVAVADSGSLLHPDLNTRWTSGYDFYDGDPDAADRSTYHHGIHVAGTIGAAANNGAGGVGVCWNCRISPLRVQASGGTTSVGSPGMNSTRATLMARAIRYAAGYPVDDGLQHVVQGARAAVINLSLGNTQEPCTTELQGAINDANTAGTPVVVAAGNVMNSDSDFARYLWGKCQGVISVAALDEYGNLEPYSVRGPGITLGAPGGSGQSGQDGYGALIGGCTDSAETRGTGTHGVVSSWTTSTGTHCYRHWAGTSMAAPHVTGVIALMKSRNAALTSAQVRAILTGTARPTSCTHNGCGAGMVDAFAAVEAATYDFSITCESGQNRFFCDVARAGGVGPFSAWWTAIANAGISSDRYSTSSVSGPCNPNTTATVELNMRDGAGRTVVRRRSFICRTVPL